MINIAEILRDCPKGMELYSPIFGDVYLYSTSPYVISVTLNEKNGKSLEQFSCDGKYTKNGECMLFPSKEQRNWHKFQMPFKDGDIISNGKFVAIFYNFIDNHLYYHCWYNKKTEDSKFKVDFGIGYGYEYRYATDEERQKLFEVIREKGYRWNSHARKIEKLITPQFKKGDRVRVKNGVSGPRIIDEVCGTFYTLVPIGAIDFTDQHNWELVEPTFKAGDKIRGKYTKNIYTVSCITPTGYKLTDGTTFDFESECCFELHKFDIATLKPFDKVLARCSTLDKWRIQFFEKYDETSIYPFICMGYNKYKQCVPYEENKHLLDTADSCDEYYKNW